MTNEPLFPQLENLELGKIPNLRHFFLTKHLLEFPFLRKVEIYRFPKMKMFVLGSEYAGSGISICRKDNQKAEVKDDPNKAIQKIFNSKQSLFPGRKEASDGGSQWILVSLLKRSHKSRA
ncbi:hypothetical protein K7X08_037708 [Anisodus acutangulus]|uniref:Uncharacterized protein n=1 Tax=Anisodus acutangulus TaxID=402998 RepID=A0A9Q1N2Z6_9SOLA|nr:hypothetical protein K7X08_037708 [Anisodus acutangulus]